MNNPCGFFFATLLLLFSAAARAGNSEEKQPVIDCGNGDKVVLFKNGVSKDGRFAVGWTIRPENDAKPVDWSRYAVDDSRGFVADLLDVNEGRDYGWYNCFVDIRGRKAMDLPADSPYIWRENHAEYGVFWSPGAKFPRYCLMQNQKRFATDNLFLIRVDAAGMNLVDLVPRLEKAVRPLLREKRPLYYKIMAVSWPNSEWDDVYKEPVFHESTVDIQFHADLPKAGYDGVTGWATVSLPEGRVLKVTCDAGRDDPLRDFPALAKADRELNEVYALLQKQLPAERLAALRKEQLDWLGRRDAGTSDDYLMVGEDIDEPVFTRERNKRLVETTEARTAELKKLVAKQTAR